VNEGAVVTLSEKVEERPIIEKQSGGGHARSWEELQKTLAGFEYVKSSSVRRTQ